MVQIRKKFELVRIPSLLILHLMCFSPACILRELFQGIRFVQSLYTAGSLFSLLTSYVTHNEPLVMNELFVLVPRQRRPIVCTAF